MSNLLPETMYGVVLTGHGGLDRLEWRDDLPVPQPGPGEVLIRVQASSVNISRSFAWPSVPFSTSSMSARS